MTLKTKVRLFIIATLLLLVAFQFSIISNFLIPSDRPPNFYILAFLIIAAITFSGVIILFLEGKLISRFYYLDEVIARITKSSKSLANLPSKGKDEISRLTDYIFGMREELQQSKDSLQNSHAILAIAQKFTSVGSWDFDFKTGKVRCSEEMYRITGLDPAHSNSDYAFMANIIHPEDREFVKTSLQEALRGSGLCSIDYRAILPGGSRRVLRAEGEVKYNTNINLFNMTGLLSDTTKQSVLDDLQSINREKVFSTVDLNPNPIVVIDSNMTVQYLNEPFEKMTGYLAKDILRTTPPYPWWPADSHKKYAKELSKDIIQGRTKKRRQLCKKKNGRNIWIEANIRPVAQNDDTVYYFFYLTDVTKQKLLEDNMKFYLAEITRTQEAEHKRIALEIHDGIIQDLASLSLGIDALGKDKNKLRDDLPGLLENLRTGIQETARKLRGLSHALHPSIIEQGLIPALEDLVQGINKWSERDINIQFVTSGNEHNLPMETELGLLRIAQEATRNIIKHSGATEAIVKLRYTSKGVKLIISDNGIGFEVPEEWEDLASKHKLGLISMLERSRLINGKISLKSRVGKGTTVIVEMAGL